MLRNGSLQRHIKETLIPTYRQRYYVLMSAINDLLFPLGVTVDINRPADSSTATAGGFFTYLRLPSDISVARTVAAFALKEQKLRMAFGHMFVVTGDEGSVVRAEADDGFATCVRLCWAWHEEGELREGIERLKDAIVNIKGRIKRGEVVDDGAAIGIR